MAPIGTRAPRRGTAIPGTRPTTPNTHTAQTLDALEGYRDGGRPPQALAGVGFSAQGLFEGSCYRRAAGASDPRVSWIFDGVEDEVLGDFGLSGGGAASYELDQVDRRLGSPEHTVVRASSEGHGENFVLVPEERLTHVNTWIGEPPRHPGRTPGAQSGRRRPSWGVRTERGSGGRAPGPRPGSRPCGHKPLTSAARTAICALQHHSRECARRGRDPRRRRIPR